MHDIFFPLINGFFGVLKSFENIPSILEMLGNLRVIRKSLMKNWESSEVFGLVNSWAVWPLTTIFGVLGVFLAVSRVFGGIMGCSRGVPELFRGVPGCSGVFRGCSGVFRGCSGVFRGVPGCSGFYRHPWPAACRVLQKMPRCKEFSNTFDRRIRTFWEYFIFLCQTIQKYILVLQLTKFPSLSVPWTRYVTVYITGL